MSNIKNAGFFCGATMKKHFYFLLVSLLPQYVAATSFFKGVDLSYVNQMEDCGAVFKDGGVVKDPYTIMADHGANLVRVRLFHDPLAWSAFPSSYSGYADVKETIQRAKSEGMEVLLDFHYSDTFADPGKQYIPAAWSTFINNTTQLETEIHNYTEQVLTDLAADGLLPEFVQIGNETNGNLLSGANPYPVDWSRQSAIINSAIDAVREIDIANNVHTHIVLHIANPAQADFWFDAARNNGISDFDIIGLSYYPQFHGSDLSTVGNTVESLRAEYNRNVMLVEVGVPWTTAFNDSSNNLLNTMPVGYGSPSISAQRAWLLDAMDEFVDHGGIGMIYWEPAWVTTGCSTEFSPPSGGSAWENATFFDFSNNLLASGGVGFIEQPVPSINAFSISVEDYGNAWGNGIQGQAFSPIENAIPNPGLPDTVYLTAMSFTQGGNPGGATTTAVHIYRPNGSTLSNSDYIGQSTNNLDTTAALDTVYRFEFDNLALDFYTTYLAVFVDSLGQPVGLGLQQGWEGNPGIGNYERGGAIFDYDLYGWTEDTNADFSADFSTIAPLSPPEVEVPAIGWFGLIILSMAGLVVSAISRNGR